jgi:hypothetical protein
MTPRAQITPPPSRPKIQPERPATPRKREVTLRLPGPKLMVLMLIAVCLVGVGAFMVVTRLNRHDPLPANIKCQANFPLYYPTKVPAGFRFDEAAYDPETHVVTYDYSTVDGNKVYFSLQPKPAHFNFNDFNKKQISGGSQVSTSIGTATVGVLQKQTVSSLVTDKTWILIGAGGKINISQLTQISQSMAPVRK